MKKEILNHLTWVVNRLAEEPVWGKCVQKNSDTWDQFYKSLRKHLDITKLTREEAVELRFGKSDEDSDLYLFPLWMVPLIPDGMMVTSIGGEEFPFNSKTTDTDVRFGCVAFGLKFKEDPQPTAKEEPKPPVKKDLADAVAETCHDFTMKMLALADEYGKDRNRHMKNAVMTLFSVNLVTDFSDWPIGGDK